MARLGPDAGRGKQEPAGLDAATIALVRVAVATALADERQLGARMRAARGAGVPDAWMEELLLQSLLNVGYPRALASWAVWRDVSGPVRDAGEPVDHRDWERWGRRGQEACGAVYGRTFHKLLVHLRALHPALEPLVVLDAYGKILGRPGLDARRRELCTLAAIAPLDTPRQLHAHLRGALNTGATREEVDAVLALLEPDLGPERSLKVWELWANVRERGETRD
ncbi:MAG: carboxymuconolactone decarboxylase family protein [Gemmatimonadales bacterium]